MKTYTITAKGKTEFDIVLAIKEALKLIESGYYSGLDSNDTGSYSFESKGEYEEEAQD